MLNYIFSALIALPTLFQFFGTNTAPLYVKDYDTWADAPECNTAKNTAWLTQTEQKIVREINMVRSNPQRYLRYVEEYRNILQQPPPKRIELIRTRYTYDSWGNAIALGQDTTFVEEATNTHITADRLQELSDIEELIAELRTAQPQKMLLPSSCLTEAAREQGSFCKEQARLTHSGRNGKEFDVRLQSFCGEMNYGGETIAGGAGSARQTVLNWLIDCGLKTRNHRKILLHPNTSRIGIFYVGKVGDLRNSWVCNFAE
jgi:uncharacterized protein YkwD